MNLLNSFADLTAAGSRLGFFTLQNCEDIPRGPGCYGWFVPLWLLQDTLPDFLNTYGRVLTHEPSQPPELDAGFTWDAVRVRVRRSFDPALPSFAEPLWNRLRELPAASTALQQILLQSSILIPPLYVGKTQNLHQRYTRHTTKNGSGFHRRFRQFAAHAKLPLQVVDLLFVCISTADHDETVQASGASEKQINDLLEEILKSLCRPPFSRQ